MFEWLLLTSKASYHCVRHNLSSRGIISQKSFHALLYCFMMNEWHLHTVVNTGGIFFMFRWIQNNLKFFFPASLPLFYLKLCLNWFWRIITHLVLGHSSARKGNKVKWSKMTTPTSEGRKRCTGSKRHIVVAKFLGQQLDAGLPSSCWNWLTLCYSGMCTFCACGQIWETAASRTCLGRWRPAFMSFRRVFACQSD